MLIYSALFSLIQHFLCLIFSSRWFDGSIWEYLTVVHPIIQPLFPYRAQFNSIHFISLFLPIFPSDFSLFLVFFLNFSFFISMIYFPFFFYFSPFPATFSSFIKLITLLSFHLFPLYSLRTFFLFFFYLVFFFFLLHKTFVRFF